VYKSALEVSSQALKTGNILIHCAGGIGRTGTFTIILLKKLGFSFEEALKITNDAGSNPETPEQIEFCKNYKSSLLNRGDKT
jgi:protein-tyrosine phosphatase